MSDYHCAVDCKALLDMSYTPFDDNERVQFGCLAYVEGLYWRDDGILKCENCLGKKRVKKGWKRRRKVAQKGRIIMLNELSKEIHANAVAHGFYDPEPSFEDTIANIHAELSEVWEEYRNGPDVSEVYFTCVWHDTRAKCPDKYDGCQHGANLGCLLRKPEGIAVELADCVMRILDYCGWLGFDVDYFRSKWYAPSKYADYALPLLISNCHSNISTAYTLEVLNPDFLIYCIDDIEYWLKENGIDLIEVIKLKHEYNKQRSYRHGGKIV